MKIIRKNFVCGGTGSIKLMPEDADDLWYVFNLIGPNDSVMAVTARKVQKDESGNREPERVTLKLEVQAEGVEFNKDRAGAALRVWGKNIRENVYVKIGAYHTLELTAKRVLVLRKQVWDSSALDTLKKASGADLAVVLMQEGLAHVIVIGRTLQDCRKQIETSVPRKHNGHSSAHGYESALKKFFGNVLKALLTHVDFSVVRCVVIASPGFTKDQFHSHLLWEAERRQLRPIIENKSRILLTHASSGYEHSLREVLCAPNVMNMIKDARIAKEVRALESFFKMLSNDPYRACYGPRHVEVAHESMAIKTLLITDELFKSHDVKERKKYEDFKKSVEESGGEAFVLSSMHVSGEQLAQLTGIAAILRFPLPELDDIEL